MGWYGWKPYVPVAERRAQARKKLADAAKKGQPMSPVVLEGREVAKSFWGKAWCENLERYADYANRIDRGLRYVRNGSVIDLQVEAGLVRAKVMGTRLYKIEIKIDPLSAAKWNAVKKACAGSIGTLVELLEGKVSAAVMKVVSEKGKGLFPAPSEIKLACSCPDWADLCKHLAAALYGVGSRLDEKPELLFLLRGVDAKELVSQHVGRAVKAVAKKAAKTRAPKVKHRNLGELFGIDLKGK